MTDGYHTDDGYVEGPLDDRDENDPDFVLDEEFCCTNTQFGGRDPAEDRRDNQTQAVFYGE